MALVPFPSAAPAPQPEPDDEYRDSDADELDSSGAKMSFLEHLDELRKRLLVSVWALGIGCAIAFIFVGRLQDFILLPIARVVGNGQADQEALQIIAPLGGLMLMMKIGALGGLFLAMPVIVLQLWLFIAPGLYRNEKRFAIPFVLMGTICFLLGAAFSHYIAFPYSWTFFKSFERSYLRFTPDVGYTFSLWLKMLLAFGAIFQMPTIVFFLARMGVVSAGFLIKHVKYAVLIIFVLAAVLSPGTDVVSQAMMAGPMLVLYGISIVIAWAFQKRRPADE
jgi:sec-independent protein translocase protein TatC